MSILWDILEALAAIVWVSFYKIYYAEKFMGFTRME
jgi:hypothetical protein